MPSSPPLPSRPVPRPLTCIPRYPSFSLRSSLPRLSLHNKITPPAGGLVSGTESDSDSVFSPDHASPSAHAASVSGSSSAPPPLSAIVERRGPAGGEDSEDDEDDNDAPFMAGDGDGDGPHKAGESDLRAGYLWKKGERRKVRRAASTCA